MKPETYKKSLSHKTINELIKILDNKFNKLIRERDKLEPCISCGRRVNLEAGHYYSAGKVRSLRYNEKNVNGQCKKCNRHLHGNLIEYRKGLIRKYGEEAVNLLDIKADSEKKNGFCKYEKFELIGLILKYKYGEV